MREHRRRPTRSTVKEIRTRVLPELDDEFAKDLGEFESLAALRDRVRADLEDEARGAREAAGPDRAAEAAGAAGDVRAARVAGRARDRPPARGVRPAADAAERRPAAGRASTGRSSGKPSGSRRGTRSPAPWCWTRSPGARTLRLRPEDVDKEIEQFAERAGRTPAALRAQLEKEGGISRLYAGLRREKAVDLALSRATMTGE